MKLRGARWFLTLVPAVALALAGCGDSNVFKGAAESSGATAQREEGLAALNEGNWDEAARIFEQLHAAGDRSPEVTRYLASAYLGQSGFDTLTLIEDIGEAPEDDAESVVYSSVTEIFGRDAADGLVSAEELASKLEKLEAALELLGAEPAGADAVAAMSSTEEDTEVFQRGLSAGIHAVLLVVDQLVDPATGRRILTKAAFDALGPAEKREVIDAVTVPDGFNRDLAYLDEARAVIADRIVDGDPGEVEEQFRKFLTSIGYLAEDGSVDGVDDEELRSYLERLFDMDAA